MLDPDLQLLIIASLGLYGGVPRDGKALAELTLGLVELVKNDKCALHIGIENGRMLALSVTILPLSVLQSCPQVAHFYNKGSNKLKRTLRDAIADFLRASSYACFRTVNITDASDSVYTRAFWHGGKSRRIGTVMEFDL